MAGLWNTDKAVTQSLSHFIPPPDNYHNLLVNSRGLYIVAALG